MAFSNMHLELAARSFQKIMLACLLSNAANQRWCEEKQVGQRCLSSPDSFALHMRLCELHFWCVRLNPFSTAYDCETICPIMKQHQYAHTLNAGNLPVEPPCRILPSQTNRSSQHQPKGGALLLQCTSSLFGKRLSWTQQQEVSGGPIKRNYT